METQTISKPIGYWLKRADEAITRAADELHAEHGLTRLYWQAFNVVAEADGVAEQDVFETLRPFAEPSELKGILRGLEQRGWLEHQGANLTLTETGRTAHREAMKRQHQLRTRTMAGVSKEEYETVLRVLGRIVANLS